LGIASPFVGDLKEENAAAEIVDLFGQAGAFVRRLKHFGILRSLIS